MNMSKDSTGKPERGFKFLFLKPVPLELASGQWICLLPLYHKEIETVEELIMDSPSGDVDSFKSALLQTVIRQCPEDHQESADEELIFRQLTGEEITQLNVTDWELIASEFLSKFRACFSVFVDEDTDTSRSDEEDSMMYLHRLISLEVERDRERSKKQMKSIGKQWGPMFTSAEDFRSTLLADLEPSLDSVKHLLGSIPQDSILSQFEQAARATDSLRLPSDDAAKHFEDAMRGTDSLSKAIEQMEQATDKVDLGDRFSAERLNVPPLIIPDPPPFKEMNAGIQQTARAAEVHAQATITLAENFATSTEQQQKPQRWLLAMTVTAILISAVMLWLMYEQTRLMRSTLESSGQTSSTQVGTVEVQSENDLSSAGGIAPEVTKEPADPLEQEQAAQATESVPGGNQPTDQPIESAEVGKQEHEAPKTTGQPDTP